MELVAIEFLGKFLEVHLCYVILNMNIHPFCR